MRPSTPTGRIPHSRRSSRRRICCIAFSGAGGTRRSGGLFRRAKRPELKPGIYLDGGFGVGKTHLLAAVYHAMPARRKYFGSFIEYTALVGALGYQNTVELFRGSDLLCIDEFELDDPGDTMVMTRLLAELVSSGTRLAATSNTPPNALGEGRFAAQDFLREIHAMAASFQTIRIDGTDYRHRAVDGHADVLDQPQYEAAIADAAAAGLASDDAFDDLVAHLARVHPSRYIRIIEGLSLVGLRDVEPLHRPVRRAALRRVHRPRVRRRSCRSARPAHRSTWSSPRRCSPAATARSTCAPSHGSSPRRSPEQRVPLAPDSRRAPADAKHDVYARAHP